MQGKNNYLPNDKSSERLLKLNVQQSAKSPNPSTLEKNDIPTSQRLQNFRKNIYTTMNKQRATTDVYDARSFLSGTRNNDETQKREFLELQRRYTEGRSPSKLEIYKQLNSKEKAEDKMYATKNLAKNFSNPLLGTKKVENEKNHDYFKLQDKLSSIETRIEEMRRQVIGKREEKQITLTSKAKVDTPKVEETKPKVQQKQKVQFRGNLKQLVTQQPERNELHYATINPYSPKHNIYYISEIVKTHKEEKSLGRQHLLLSLKIFKMLANTCHATEDKIRQKQVNLSRKQGYQGKKTLIFDLDETLIHCNDSLTLPYDVKLAIPFPNGQIIEAGINIRPYAFDILKNLSKKFEIIVFTASHSCYANVVLDHLDPNHEFIQHRLYRQHCYQTPEGMYCKDLRIINRQMKDMILVDNAAYSYAPQPDNGIPILPYYHGRTDYELKALQSYLNGMVLIQDARVLNRKTFQLHRYHNYYNDPNRLVAELYTQQEVKNL